MGELTNAQRDELREFLVSKGLSFKPLQEELVDHIGCDLEERMSEGLSFHEAFHQFAGEIPDNHFIYIQKEVMETINKRFAISRGLSFLALALLLISTLFKALHLQFGGFILLLSFGLIAAALLTSSLSGIFLNKEKKGALSVLGVILGIIVLLIGFSFKLLHMRGADQLIIFAVALLIVALVVNTIRIYQHARGEGNLLTFLHEKYTPGIERFFLFLLTPLLIFKAIWILYGEGVFVGNFILLVVIFGSGLQFIALCWRSMEQNLSKRNARTLSATIVSCFCLCLPFLGPVLALEVRVILISLNVLISAWLAYNFEEEPVKLTSLIMASLVPVLFLGWALLRLGIIPSSSHGIFFNLPILALLVAGLFLSRKHSAMRAYMLVSVSGYLFEYIS